MANQCENQLYVMSRNEENLKFVLDFLSEYFWPYDSKYDDIYSLNVVFTSDWTFPEELMKELFEALPDKSNIYMRCLSIEYGMHYHALWECSKNGWIEY